MGRLFLFIAIIAVGIFGINMLHKWMYPEPPKVEGTSIVVPSFESYCGGLRFPEISRSV